MEENRAFSNEIQAAASSQEWSWWSKHDGSASNYSEFPESETLHPTTSALVPDQGTITTYASDYGEDWLAEQLANIPLLAGDAGDSSDLLHPDKHGNHANYVMVADRELVAILGGHVDRDTIYWLLANFKLERNAVMPRGFLYSKYEAFCNAHGKLLMNQACMGKTVRALFRGLETRRLGRRGKSRYHYIGLAINPEGEFAGMVPLEPEEPAPEPGDGERKRRRVSRTTTATKKVPENPVGKQFECMDPDNRLEMALDQLDKLLNVRRNRALIPPRLRQEHLWDSMLPFDYYLLPDGLSKQDVHAILKDFRVHVGLLGHSMTSGVLLAIPSILENFWMTHITSLQIPETFDLHKFNMALQWQPLTECFGHCLVELYGSVIEQLLPKMDKPLNGQTLEFLYEFASKYAQWIKATASHLSFEIQVVLNAAAVTFCQTLKQMIVLNSVLGMVDLVERDRSKASVISEGFRALSDRFVLIANVTQPREQLITAIHNMTIMESIVGHDSMLQRWRGWTHNMISIKLNQAQQAAAGLPDSEILLIKEAALADLRQVWMGLLTEMQRNIERSGKEYATPMTCVLNYYIHYANYALDNFQANLHRMTLLQYGYQMSKHVLQTTDYLHLAASPSYDITFFSHRYITNLNINVYDFHYYGNFDELRPLIYLPNFGLSKPPFPNLSHHFNLSSSDQVVPQMGEGSSVEAYVESDGTAGFPVYHARDAVMSEQDLMTLEAIEAAAHLDAAEEGYSI